MYLRKEMRYMKTATKAPDSQTKPTATDTSLFSYLDKGIDDLENQNMYSLEEAYRIIINRLKYVL